MSFLFMLDHCRKVGTLMKNRILRIVIPVVTIAVLLTAAVAYFGSAASVGKAKASSNSASGLTRLQLKLLDGLASSEINAQNSGAARSKPLNYFPDHADDQCSLNKGSNVKVNQNCLNLTDPTLQGRAQAQNETSIAEDPLNPNHLVASYNDYRRGDGTCGADYSLDGGVHWNDSTLPNGFTSGAAFGGVFMFRSTQNFGASWNFTGRPVAQDFDMTGATLLDKPYMTVDNHVGSPFRDRIYVTYTFFGSDGTAKIFEAFSSNFGETFSSPVLVSTTSTLCPHSVVGTGNCDANQFSDPFTGSDGNLYVIYDNFNNSLSSTTDNHNQILLSKSTDGGVSFSPPVLVANYNDLPDCDTYQGAGQDPGRACVPEKGTSNHSV